MFIYFSLNRDEVEKVKKKQKAKEERERSLIIDK
jgi:hypothetical protein